MGGVVMSASERHKRFVDVTVVIVGRTWRGTLGNHRPAQGICGTVRQNDRLFVILTQVLQNDLPEIVRAKRGIPRRLLLAGRKQFEGCRADKLLHVLRT